MAERVLAGLKQRIPELFKEDGSLAERRVHIPVEINGNQTLNAVPGQQVGNNVYYKNGHQVLASGNKLRWLAVTVEGGVTKFDFIANLTLTAGTLTLDKFQLNTFLMGVRTTPPDPISDAWDYLAEYMDEDNDWHQGYEVLPFTDAEETLHPDKEFLIPSEAGTAPTRSMQVTVIRPENAPKLLNWLGGSTFEKLKVREGEIIHGILWVNTKRTRKITGGSPYPMFLYHGLTIRDCKDVEGIATRCLIGTSPRDHESGSVNLTDAVTELREKGKAVFIKYDETIVLDVFHQFTHDEAIVYGQRMASPPEIMMPDFMM